MKESCGWPCEFRQKRFNRTLEELKDIIEPLPYSCNTTFNRTLEELKVVHLHLQHICIIAFNRTLEELKV